MLVNVLVTLLLTLTIGGLLFGLFCWIKTPYYRIDRERMVRVLERVLTGQATENDWRLTFGIIIRHDSELESIRQECMLIEEKYYRASSRSDFIFTESGLVELKDILCRLNNQSE